MIDQKLFVEALRFVSHCAALKDVRYYLNGVRFQLTPATLTMIAIDGHRMAVAEISGEFNHTGAVTVKGSDIKFLLTALKPIDGRVQFAIGVESFTIESGTVQLLKFEGLGGTYPDWKRVMPQGEPVATASWGVNSVYLADAAKACDRLSGRYSGAKLEFRGASESAWITPDILPTFQTDGLRMAGVVLMPMRL